MKSEPKKSEQGKSASTELGHQSCSWVGAWPHGAAPWMGCQNPGYPTEYPEGGYPTEAEWSDAGIYARVAAQCGDHST